MDHMLRTDIAEGLRAASSARMVKENAGYSVDCDGVRHRILRLRRNGFDLRDEGGALLRGYVDLCKGSRRIARCLIIAARQMEGEVRYEIKQKSVATDHAPLDYARVGPEIAGLLTHS